MDFHRFFGSELKLAHWRCSFPLTSSQKFCNFFVLNFAILWFVGLSCALDLRFMKAGTNRLFAFLSIFLKVFLELTLITRPCGRHKTHLTLSISNTLENVLRDDRLKKKNFHAKGYSPSSARPKKKSLKSSPAKKYEMSNRLLKKYEIFNILLASEIDHSKYLCYRQRV